jgi:broad specificity phosphatase PhoE
MPRLIAALMRHGDYRQLPDTPSAHQPFPLTEKGRQQAREAAIKLRQESAQQGWKIAAELHSSQLLRAWETTAILAQELNAGHGVRAFDALAERSVGSAANLTIAQIEAIIREDPRYEPLPEDWKSNSRFCLPLQGAESLLQAGARVAEHLKATMRQLEEQVSEDTLQVFVGHGAAMRHAAYHLGVLDFGEVSGLSMYHAEPVYIELTTDGWLQVAGQWKVRGKAVELD